ncbi:MAG: glucose-6-phosphate dehydrogenase assembly protein OpcA [Chloroflexota bacterium]|nr:glucose-6-phosphate dehydrogenase assembly protein OpcA [Chloroflexota bacterium]MDE2896875.1 glucose-6-phosphate dehydrogenase assembly protein OpcA [Chloroflexota bacterium]
MNLTTTIADTLPTLARLREQAARQAADAGAELNAQMLLATIVARYPEPTGWAEIEAETQPVVAAYPGRVIALVNDPDTARSSDPVRVSLLSARRSDGASAIRGELLTAALQGRAFEEGAAIAASWSASGVPTVVWWNGPAVTDDHLFDDMLDIADRILVDSSAMTDVVADFAVLGDVVTADHHARVTDALWLRLLAWRQAFAQAFDQPAARIDLEHVRSVELAVQQSPGGHAAALLLVGWMASRLGWRLDRRTAQGWRLASDGHAVDVICEPSSTPNVLIEMVRLSAPTSRYLAHMPSPEDIVVDCQSDLAPITHVAVRRPPPTRPRLRLDDLLTGGAHYPVFQQSVTLARTLAAA